jgi:small subunit ribosomal protein S20
MANIKSQIKRNRQNDGRRQRNRAVTSALKTQIKRYEQAVETGDAQEAEQELRATTIALDKAASKGIIHKNKAANKKARLAKKLPSK